MIQNIFINDMMIDVFLLYLIQYVNIEVHKISLLLSVCGDEEMKATKSDV